MHPIRGRGYDPPTVGDVGMPASLKNWLRPYYRNTPLWYATHPRRFQAYCVGTAKSGTHSIAALLERRYRVCHEAEDDQMIDVVFAAAEGRMSDADVTRWLVKRDKRLWLEMDASQLNYFFVRQLATAFPDSKYILTIRDCYSFVDSFINHQLARPAPEHWRKLRDFRFKPEHYPPGEHERPLADRGLYSLDG